MSRHSLSSATFSLSLCLQSGRSVILACRSDTSAGDRPSPFSSFTSTVGRSTA